MSRRSTVRDEAVAHAAVDLGLGCGERDAPQEMAGLGLGEGLAAAGHGVRLEQLGGRDRPSAAVVAASRAPPAAAAGDGAQRCESEERRAKEESRAEPGPDRAGRRRLAVASRSNVVTHEDLAVPAPTVEQSIVSAQACH